MLVLRMLVLLLLMLLLMPVRLRFLHLVLFAPSVFYNPERPARASDLAPESQPSASRTHALSLLCEAQRRPHVRRGGWN